MIEDVTDIALAYLQHGFTPVRIEPKEKMPRSQGWQVDTPTEEKIRRAYARPSNIGIRTGDPLPDGTYLIAIDVDLEDHGLLRCVQRAIGETVPAKKGKKGCTYFVRIDREIKTHKIQWVRDGKKKSAIDVLARGAQTVVPPSIHPETEQPYYWVQGTPLHELDIRTLPVFSDKLLDEIRGFCKNADDAIHALNDMEWAGVGGGGNTHDVCTTAVASMVARQWSDSDIQERIVRAKREAAELAGLVYDWPQSQKVIQEWIDSSRDKKFDTVTKSKSGDVPEEMLSKYVYVIELDRMLDRTKGTLYNFTTFCNIHARDCGKPWTAMITHPDLAIVDKLTYSPGQPQFCKEKSNNSEATMDCFNMFYCPDLEPEEGDVEPFTNLIRDVFDHDEAAIKHVTSFLAHTVQFPGERINHALVIQGKQGIGKDTLAAAMEKVLGTQNVSQVTLAHIESQFNDWLFGKQLIVFQEMLAAGRRNIYNKIKTIITDPVHSVNAKHLAMQKVPNRANYIALTNYKHALSIDPSDRRFWVWYSKMTPKSPEYYKAFYRWLSDRRSSHHLLHYLLNYDTSKFNPMASPPMTDAKRSMIRASASEVEQYLREAWESGTWPMEYEVISVPHVVASLRPLMRVSASMVAEAIDHICGEDNELPHRPAFGSRRLRVRAIRNLDKWKVASAVEVAKYYRMPTPPQAGDTEGGYSKYDGTDSPQDGPAY